MNYKHILSSISGIKPLSASSLGQDEWSLRFPSFRSSLAAVMILSVFALAPITPAFADTGKHGNFWTDASVGAFLKADGAVRVMGATITSLSGNVLTATTAFGSSLLNWIVNVDGNTKIVANGSGTASTTALKVGDKIIFSGTATATSGPATVVTARTIFDATSMKDTGTIAGTVNAVSAASGSYSITTKKGNTVTVNTNAATSFKVNGDTGAFASVLVGSTISVTGILNADSSVITASNVSVKNKASLNDHKDWKQAWNDWKDEKHDSKDDNDNRFGMHLGLKHLLNFGR